MLLLLQNIHDLMTSGNEPLKIKEDVTKGIYVGGLIESRVMSPQDVESILQKGDVHRRVGETNMNERSSRSHSYVTLNSCV